MLRPSTRETNNGRYAKRGHSALPETRRTGSRCCSCIPAARSGRVATTAPGRFRRVSSTRSETPEAAARREFAEETGIALTNVLTPLPPVVQSRAKTVHAFAAEGDIDPADVRSNMFEMEWPKHSGRRSHSPKSTVPRGSPSTQAHAKIVAGQRPLLDALRESARRRVAGLTGFRACLAGERDLHAPVALVLRCGSSARGCRRSRRCSRTCVPPHGCRSMPGMLQQPHAPGAARRLHAHRLDELGARIELLVGDPDGFRVHAARDQRVRLALDAARRRAGSCRCRSRAAPCRARCCRR